MPKTTISITCLGTTHHRSSSISILTAMHEEIERQSALKNSTVAAWLIDGVGSVGTPEHPSPGTYIYKNGQKIVTSKDVVWQQLNHFNSFLNNKYRAITGDGIESSLLEAILYVKDIIKQNNGKLPNQINLQGFSRGADTCVRIANILYRLHPSIKVNLFLIDPVPGPGRRQDPDSYTIPPNVNECKTILMLNEHRKFYQPQHRRRYIFTNLNTHVSFQYLAGRHGAGIMTSEIPNMLYPRSSQILTHDNMLRFQIKHGSLSPNTTIKKWHLTNTTAISLENPQGLLSDKEVFANLCDAMACHKKLAARMEMNLYSQRYIFRNRNENLLQPELFLDHAHIAMFKKIFPATFHWFFEKNIKIPGMKQYTREEVFQELQALNQPDFESFYQTFLKIFAMTSVERIEDVIEPQGIARLAPVAYEQPLVTNELSYLKHSLQSIIDYYNFHYDEKNYVSSQQALEIQNGLQDATMLPDKSAKVLLQNIMAKTQGSSFQNTYISQEISKIIPDSQKYIDNVDSILKKYLKNLPKEQAQVVQTVLRLIEKQRTDPIKDVYQKRLKIQHYLISLDSSILDMKQQSPNMDTHLFQELSQTLNHLTTPSYLETHIMDTIINDLKSYLFWRSFLVCFPSKYGWHVHEKITLAKDMLMQIQALKDTGRDKNNLMAIKSILNSNYENTLNQENPEEHINAWNKHLTLKNDYLSKIIDKNIEQITKLMMYSRYTNQAEAISSSINQRLN